MSRRIPQTFIHELVARTDLLDLIGARVRLKKAGSNHKGLCPFHDEKTPSFTVSPEKGFYKCFGCGAYGNAIDFVMQYENRSFPEAVEILADLLQLEVPVDRDDTEHDAHTGLYAVLNEADQIYRKSLREHEHAIAYLKQRGIDGPTAAAFGIGYAPDAWDTVLKSLGGSPAAVERLIEAGLAVRNDSGRTYDRFRDRIMFPIRDGRGRVIGFGGRLLGPGEPKYLNSPDTPLFDKSRTLYGLYEARRKPGRPARIVVVEGYMDVVALSQHGLEPAIATMGTATTAENVRQLTRLSDRIVFCFDGDRAGRAAAWRALEAVLPYGGGQVELQFVLLPEGEDPDSFVRQQGQPAFEKLLEDAKPLSTFMIEEGRADIDLSSADGRSRLIEKLKPLLGRLPRGVYRELLLKALADNVGLPAARVESLLEGQPAAPAGQPAPAARNEAKPTLMRKAVTLLLHFPAAARAAGGVDGLAELDAPGAELLRRLLEIATANPKLTTGEIIESFRSESEEGWLRRLAASEPLDDGDAAPAVLRDSLERMVRHQRETRRRSAQLAEMRRQAAAGPTDP